jgi:hypothetical protein
LETHKKTLSTIQEMKYLELKRKEIDYAQYIRRSALETDYTTLITESTLVTEDGVPRILYAKLDPELTKYVRQACKNIRYDVSTRTNGLKTTSRIFGYNPRNEIRKNFCSTTSMANEHATEHAVICAFGEHLTKLYAEYFPGIYNMHDSVVQEKVLDGWRIQNTPFTSGIVNKNNPLKYHFDAGNIKDVLSNMVVFKRNISGGYLACPEFDIGFEVADNTIVLFDGQNILHGVTPIKSDSMDSYRYSVVYYTLQKMWSCLPIDEEIARARNVRVKRENKRVQGVKPDSLTYR